MRKKAILLKNCRFILTQDEKRRILENKSILIEGNRISKIGKKISKKDAMMIDCSNCAVLPGLINMHTHIPMNILRGIAPGLKLKDWLSEIFKREAKLSEEDIYHGSLDGMGESIRSGVTTILDMYFKNKAIFKAAEETGIRAFLGYGMIDLFNKEKRKNEETSTKRFIEFIRQKNNSLIKAVVSPHALNTCSRELLEWSKEYSMMNKLLLTVHAAETKEEAEFIEKKYHIEITRYLKSLEMLNAILFHGVHLDYKFIARQKEKPTVVHCPSSNLKLESGMLDIKDVINSGSNLCIGTDGPASNNNLDLLEEVKIAAMLFKANRILKGKDRLIDKYLIDAVTINPAKALHIKAGRILEEYLADITCLKLDNHLSYSNKRTLINNIIYAANSSDVERTVVNGKILFENA